MANIPFLNNAYFAGKVGIGTASPSRNLHVHADSGNAYLQLTQAATGTTSNDGFQISMGAAQVNFINRENGNMVFETNNTEKMRITNTGNVGIGTTSPQHILDVADSGINSTAPTIRLTNTANYNAGAWGGNTSHSIEFYSSDPSGNRVASAIENIAGIDKGGLLTGNLVFKTADYPTPGTLTEKMRIAEDGNVGIGTTSPTGKLDVREANVTISTSNSMSDGVRGLKIAGSNAAIEFAGSGNDWWVSALGSGLSIYDTTVNSYRFKIMNDGKVGIGTTSPSQKLHVDGSARVTGAYYDSGNTPGTANQLLSSTATGTAWIDPSTIVAEAATLVVIACKNTSGATITKGTPVYQTGNVGATATIEIAPADALISANKLPAIGVLQTDLNNNGLGNVVITGELTNFTTDPIDGLTPTVGDKIFVKSGGGLTLTKPTGEGNGIQNMGLVGKVSVGNAGSITVSSIMRTNDVPNLPEGRIWVGDGNTIVSDTVYVDEPNERIGIGTTNPSAPLSLGNGGAESLELNHNISSSSRILSYNRSNNTYRQLQLDAFEHVFKTSSSEKMRITSAGNVGIGTTSPAKTLDINGDVYINSNYPSNAAASDLTIGKTTTGDHGLTIVTGASNTAGIFFADNNNNDAGRIRYQHSNNSMRFETNRAEKMRITSDGNVGIGTTSPSKKLEVNGQTKFYEYTGAHLTNQATSNFNFDTLANNTASSNGGSVGAFIKLTGTPPGATGRWSAFRARAYGENAKGNTDDMINFFAEYRNYTSTNAVTLNHHAGLKVNSLGVGGLATVTNNYGVYLNPGTAATNNYGVYQLGTGVKNFFQGNVGIGTTSPARLLHVNSSGQTDIHLTSSGQGVSSADGMTVFLDSSGSGGLWLRESQALRFATSTTERMRITSTGNVGIGTTSPQAKLQVVYTDTHTSGDLSLSNSAFDIYNDSTTDVAGKGSTLTFSDNYSGTNKTTRAAIKGGTQDAGNTANGFLAFYTDSSAANSMQERMRIDKAGAIKFNNYDSTNRTGTPTYLLGTDASGNVVKTNTVPGSGAGPYLPLAGGTMTGQIIMGNAGGSYSHELKFANNTYIAGIDFQNSGELRFIDRSGGRESITFNLLNGSIEARNTGNTVTNFISTSGNSYLNGGNVGIGTTAPGAKLDIIGSTIGLRIKKGDLSDVLRVYSQGSGIYMDNGDVHISDNLGIGTTSPEDKVDIVGYLRISDNKTANTNKTNRIRGEHYDITEQPVTFMFMNSFSTQTTLHIGGGSTIENAATLLRFFTAANTTTTAGSERMRITSAGNVGIGTTSPGAKLQVDGSVKVGSGAVTDNNSLTVYGNNGTASKYIKLTHHNASSSSIQTDNTYLSISASNYIVLGSNALIYQGVKFTNNKKLEYQESDNSYFTVLNVNSSNLVQLGSVTGVSSGGDTALYHNGAEKVRITSVGVGIGTTSPVYKLDVNGGARAGGVITYSKSAGSLDTTGYAVAGLTTGSNGNSTGFTFTCFGNTGGYQKIVYSCYNGAGTWYPKKVIDEGTNDFDVEASANGSTITFTFKSTSGTKNYTPRVTIEATGHSINSTYA